MKHALPLLTGQLSHLVLRPQPLPFPISVNHSIASFLLRLTTVPVAIILALILRGATGAAAQFTFPYPVPANHLRIVAWNLEFFNDRGAKTSGARACASGRAWGERRGERGRTTPRSQMTGDY